MLNDLIYVLGGYTTSYPDGMYSWPYGPTIKPHATNEVYVPFGCGTQDHTYVPPDVWPPEIVVYSPANRTYYAASVELNFTVNEPTAVISYRLDGGVPVRRAGNITLGGLQLGGHGSTVYDVDVEGNMGASETIHFTIAKATKSSPVTLIAVAIGVSIAASVTAYLLHRCRKHKSQTPNLECARVFRITKPAYTTNKHAQLVFSNGHRYSCLDYYCAKKTSLALS